MTINGYRHNAREAIQPRTIDGGGLPGRARARSYRIFDPLIRRAREVLAGIVALGMHELRRSPTLLPRVRMICVNLLHVPAYFKGRSGQ